MYGDVVMGVQTLPGEHHEPFEAVISELKQQVFPKRPLNEISDTDLDASSLKELIARFKKLVRERTGRDFPSDPHEQLRGAICAVFGSWMNERAIVYRQKYNIPTEWGTAVNVQAMVFGNTGKESCSGVAFTRDPATGEKVFYGEYLINAQGEDVVAGVRTPDPVATLQEKMPRPIASSKTSAPRWKSISARCRTSSSRSKTASSSCSRPATANAPASPPFASRSKW